ncbi:hypothetical protein C7M84_010604 [Penaeus vannamei]|uniref:Endonuclease/exonuclease/phosphatase domain-containing protein n=1 Tax=Penaeus vannamei TaxID=6689 RepID=A0A423T3Y5_PENVA|nr:hypothetical protein C7M84_010604 [Penaeus vannamei]
MKGYTRWHRRDRTHGTFGGVAVSFHKSLSVQPLDVVLPSHLEIMFFKIWAQHQTVLLCVCYRPQWQGSEPIVFLQTHLDELLQLHTCNHVVIVGDMNQHLVARSFEELLTVHGLFNHVDFPTHISGSSLDPVVSDLPDSVVTCSPLSAVGSSDHMAVLNLIQVTPQRDAAVTRTNWLWGKADWKGNLHLICSSSPLPHGVCPSHLVILPPSYLGLLDKIQQRAQRLICLKAPLDQSSPLMQPLQQRRDVAGLCVIYKTHKQSAPHLTALRQPWSQPHGHATRAAATGDDQLVVPFARTETFLRSFLPRYTRMWNHLVQQTQLHRTTSLHTFKSAINLQSRPTEKCGRPRVNRHDLSLRLRAQHHVITRTMSSHHGIFHCGHAHQQPVPRMLLNVLSQIFTHAVTLHERHPGTTPCPQVTRRLSGGRRGLTSPVAPGRSLPSWKAMITTGRPAAAACGAPSAGAGSSSSSPSAQWAWASGSLPFLPR